MDIVRGTTPTIKYTFSTIAGTDITAAYLTFTQSGVVVVEKDLSDATTGSNFILWTLTQAETLLLRPCVPVRIMLNWKTTDGTRGIGKTINATVKNNDKGTVI